MNARGIPWTTFFSSAQRLDQGPQSVEIDQVAEAVDVLVKAVIEDRLAGRAARAGEGILEAAKIVACAIDRQSEIVQSLNLHR